MEIQNAHSHCGMVVSPKLQIFRLAIEKSQITQLHGFIMWRADDREHRQALILKSEYSDVCTEYS